MYNYYEGGFESMISEYCAICGKEFKIFPCRKNVTKCCSYECRNKLIVKTRRELYERQYYQDSIIIKVSPEDGLIDDIATCFNIENTMELLMLAPLEFMSRTDGIENEKEYKERLWKQVRNFYRAARDILDRRYRL